MGSTEACIPKTKKVLEKQGLINGERGGTPTELIIVYFQ